MAKKQNYAHLDYLKAFAAIFVVVHHTITSSDALTAIPTLNFIRHLIGHVVIPVFLCVSGYLCHAQPLLPYYKKKVVKILIPFVVFTSLKLAYTLLISNAHAHAASLPALLYDAFVCGNLYWFIYAIMLIYAISPLFWKLKNWNIVLCIGFFMAGSALDLMDVNLPNVLQMHKATENIGFFIFGYLLQLNKDTLQKYADKYQNQLFAICITVAATVLGVRLVRLERLPEWLKLFLSFSEMYLLYRFCKKLPDSIATLKYIGNHSLQIMFFDSFFRVILFAILPASNIFEGAIIMLLNIALTCISCYIIKKIPFVRVLFGL